MSKASFFLSLLHSIMDWAYVSRTIQACDRVSIWPLEPQDSSLHQLGIVAEIG